MAAPSAFASSVNYGPISHKNMKDEGSASPGLKLSLQVGLIANQQGIQNAVKAASNPTSSTYGQYLSLSSLQKKYGASFRMEGIPTPDYGLGEVHHTS